jgi:hypothetical protein
VTTPFFTNCLTHFVVAAVTAIIIITYSPGPDKGAQYHELFLRGKMYLAHRIVRIKIKGQGARKPAKPEDEPDFYGKPYLPVTATEQQATLTPFYKLTEGPRLGLTAAPAPFLPTNNNNCNMAYLLQQHPTTVATAFHPSMLRGVFLQQQLSAAQALFSPEAMAAWQHNRGDAASLLQQLRR